MYRKLVVILVLISFFGLKFNKVYASPACHGMNNAMESFCFEAGTDGGGTSDTGGKQDPCSSDQEKDLKSFEFMDDDFIPVAGLQAFYITLSSKLYFCSHLSCTDPSIPAFYSPPE